MGDGGGLLAWAAEDRVFEVEPEKPEGKRMKSWGKGIYSNGNDK